MSEGPRPVECLRQSQVGDQLGVPALENTIAVAELAGSRVHWLSPVDLEFESMSFAINDGPHSISSHHPTGPAVLFGDGAVFRVSPAIDPEIVRALCTIDGGEPISRDSLVAKGLLIP